MAATLVILAAFLLAGAYVASGDREFGAFAPSGQVPNSPHVAIGVSSPTQVAGNRIDGAVTITAADPASLASPIEIAVYSAGLTQTDRALRTMRIPTTVSALGAGESTTIAFGWDQRDESGRLVPTGAYAITVRAASRVDVGNSHAGTTGVAQVNVRITQ
jgi:hypothetical protein